MKQPNKLIYFLKFWVFKELSQIRQFENVIELHYFLLGYQFSEADNSINNGEGYWISDFMIYCQEKMDTNEKIILNSKINASGIIYYKKILFIQADDNNGIQIMINLFNEFVENYEIK